MAARRRIVANQCHPTPLCIDGPMISADLLQTSPQTAPCAMALSFLTLSREAFFDLVCAARLTHVHNFAEGTTRAQNLVIWVGVICDVLGVESGRKAEDYAKLDPSWFTQTRAELLEHVGHDDPFAWVQPTTGRIHHVMSLEFHRALKALPALEGFAEAQAAFPQDHATLTRELAHRVPELHAIGLKITPPIDRIQLATSLEGQPLTLSMTMVYLLGFMGYIASRSGSEPWGVFERDTIDAPGAKLYRDRLHAYSGRFGQQALARDLLERDFFYPLQPTLLNEAPTCTAFAFWRLVVPWATNLLPHLTVPETFIWMTWLADIKPLQGSTVYIAQSALFQRPLKTTAKAGKSVRAPRAAKKVALPPPPQVAAAPPTPPSEPIDDADVTVISDTEEEEAPPPPPMEETPAVLTLASDDVLEALLRELETPAGDDLLADPIEDWSAYAGEPWATVPAV